MPNDIQNTVPVPMRFRLNLRFGCRAGAGAGHGFVTKNGPVARAGACLDAGFRPNPHQTNIHF